MVDLQVPKLITNTLYICGLGSPPKLSCNTSRSSILSAFQPRPAQTQACLTLPTHLILASPLQINIFCVRSSLTNRANHNTGSLQPTIPHSLPLWRRSGHPWPRVLRRLPLLHRLHPPNGRSRLLCPRCSRIPRYRQASARYESVLSRSVGIVDEWIDGRVCWVYLDVDVILWVGESVKGLDIEGQLRKMYGWQLRNKTKK